MLLTLSASALKSKLAPAGGGRGFHITDIPKFARTELGLTGMVLSTDLLAGADRPQLTKLLEAADKAGCPCLVLIETKAQTLADPNPTKVAAAVERCMRVAQAAAWLGCSAFAVPVLAASDADLALAASNLRPVSRRAEKLELNLCIVPHAGATSTPEKVTDLLKKIGGFRVGTLPDFAAAAMAAEPTAYLRRLAPYASAILAPAIDPAAEPSAAPTAAEEAAPKKKPAKAPKAKASKKKGASAEGESPADGAPAATAVAAPAASPGPGPGGDLTSLIKILVTVGYDGPLALDYRGTGDPVPAILATRDMILKIVGGPPDTDDDLLLDEDEIPGELPDEPAESP